MKGIYRFILVLFVIALGLEIVNVFISNKVASQSISVTKINTKIAQLKEENMILSSQVLSYTSYEAVSKKAELLGFARDRNTILMFDSPQVALR